MFGGITPKGTLITCEETQTAEDQNGDGIMDVGWSVEIDPRTRSVIDQDGDGNPDKLWSMGRFQHENVAMSEAMHVVYQGADHLATGYVYKFIPVIPGNFSNGQLFVLRLTSDSTGVWEKIPNDSKNARNYTVNFAASVGAENFRGVEDVEIGPDGKIYFTSKDRGVVYRFSDKGSAVKDLEIFAGGRSYPINYGEAETEEDWGIGNDNLAFDGEGNLWVLQDGGKNYVWVVGKNHTESKPDVRIFARVPAGSEATGITFSPDYRYLFLSLQHPSAANNQPQTDASGADVQFNRDATLIIALKKDLGREITPDIPSRLKISRVFPVPAREKISLRVEATEYLEAEISLIDSKGQALISVTETFYKGETEKEFDVSFLKPGGYFIRVRTDKEEEAVSFVKI